MSGLSRIHANVEGHVQGVGFRQFVFQTALGLDLTGWVRNTYDGGVEVTAEGSQEVLEMLLSALYHGPRHAYVTNVHFEFSPPSGEFEDFRIRSTV